MYGDPVGEMWREVAEELAFALQLERKKSFLPPPDQQWWRDAADEVAEIHVVDLTGAALSRAALDLVAGVAAAQGKVADEHRRHARKGRCEAGAPTCPLHLKSRWAGGSVRCPEKGCGWGTEQITDHCPHLAVAEVSDETVCLRVCHEHLRALRQSRISDLRVTRLGAEDG